MNIYRDMISEEGYVQRLIIQTRHAWDGFGLGLPRSEVKFAPLDEPDLSPSMCLGWSLWYT